MGPGSSVIQRLVYPTEKNISLQGISQDLLSLMYGGEKLSVFSPILVGSQFSFIHSTNIYLEMAIPGFDLGIQLQVKQTYSLLQLTI